MNTIESNTKLSKSKNNPMSMIPLAKCFSFDRL